MIEAWLSASETIRSVSPVIGRDDAGVGGEPGLEGQHGGHVLEGRQLGLERLVHRHRPGDRPDGAAAGPELADGGSGRVAHARVVGQPEVVVRRQADEPAVVDRDDRALGGRHDPQPPIEVALAQGGDLVVEEGEWIGAAGRAGLCSAHDIQSMMTLPESPCRAAAKAASYSRNPNRWVMAGVMSSPDWSMTVILYQVSYISRP